MLEESGNVELNDVDVDDDVLSEIPDKHTPLRSLRSRNLPSVIPYVQQRTLEYSIKRQLRK